jgi:hypothetical protein
MTDPNGKSGSGSEPKSEAGLDYSEIDPTQPTWWKEIDPARGRHDPSDGFTVDKKSPFMDALVGQVGDALGEAAGCREVLWTRAWASLVVVFLLVGAIQGILWLRSGEAPPNITTPQDFHAVPGQLLVPFEGLWSVENFTCEFRGFRIPGGTDYGTIEVFDDGGRLGGIGPAGTAGFDWERTVVSESEAVYVGRSAMPGGVAVQTRLTFDAPGHFKAEISGCDSRVAEGTFVGDEEAPAGDPGTAAPSDAATATPSWLPPGFPVPVDSEMTNTYVDPDTGDRSVLYLVKTRSVGSVAEQMRSALVSQGYEQFPDERTGVLIFGRDDIGLVTIDFDQVTTTEALVSITIGDADLGAVSAEYGGEVVATGSATVNVDGLTIEAVGECQVQDAGGLFTSDDGSVSLQVDSDADPVYVEASIVRFNDGVQLIYSMSSSLDGGDEIVVTTGPDGFSASGLMHNLADPIAELTEGSIVVECG